jgi:hypothetical protein
VVSEWIDAARFFPEKQLQILRRFAPLDDKQKKRRFVFTINDRQSTFHCALFTAHCLLSAALTV